MKRFLLLTAVLAALFTFSTAAEAGHGWRSYGWRGGFGARSRFVSRRHSFGHRSHCGPYVHRTWHDTSHYDYHPGEYVPHANHYDYIPGHWHLHRTGHWDTHLHH